VYIYPGVGIVWVRSVLSTLYPHLIHTLKGVMLEEGKGLACGFSCF